MSLAEFRALDSGQGRRLTARSMRHLLAFSLLAPSTHNSVPQSYELEPEAQRIGFWLRRRHVLPASDPTGREALISIGCAVESLIIAAAEYGFEGVWTPDTDVTWNQVTHSSGSSEVRIGAVQFVPLQPALDEPARGSYLRLLCDRKVIRAEFDASVPLQRDLIEAIERAARPSSACVQLRLFETDREKFAWGKLDELATKHKLEQRSFQLELGQCLVPDHDTTTARGMRGREFGIEPAVASRLSAQLRGEVAMTGDQLALMARAARAGLTSSSAICALCCLDASPSICVEAGRLYQRVTLEAFRHGFANAVHTAVCEVPHARKMCEATLLSGLTPAVVFRLGRPLNAEDWSRPHSSRPFLDDVIRAHGAREDTELDASPVLDLASA